MDTDKFPSSRSNAAMPLRSTHLDVFAKAMRRAEPQLLLTSVQFVFHWRRSYRCLILAVCPLLCRCLDPPGLGLGPSTVEHIPAIDTPLTIGQLLWVVMVGRFILLTEVVNRFLLLNHK